MCDWFPETKTLSRDITQRSFATHKGLILLVGFLSEKLCFVQGITTEMTDGDTRMGFTINRASDRPVVV